MTIEIRDASLEARIQKQLQATGFQQRRGSAAPPADTQEEQDRWLEVCACMGAQAALG